MNEDVANEDIGKKSSRTPWKNVGYDLTLTALLWLISNRIFCNGANFQMKSLCNCYVTHANVRAMERVQENMKEIIVKDWRFHSSVEQARPM